MAKRRSMSVEKFPRFLDGHMTVQRYGHEMGLTKRELLKLYRRGVLDSSCSDFELQTYLERVDEMLEEECKKLDMDLSKIGA